MTPPLPHPTQGEHVKVRTASTHARARALENLLKLTKTYRNI